MVHETKRVMISVDRRKTRYPRVTDPTVPSRSGVPSPVPGIDRLSLWYIHLHFSSQEKNLFIRVTSRVRTMTLTNFSYQRLGDF